MKTVLFVPGFQEGITSRDYAKTITAIKTAGYKVKFVSINWLRTTIEQWVEELDEAYRQYDPKDTILAGFSFGAMTALMSSAKRHPSALWLFSLSPYFSEDLADETFKKSWLEYIGHRRVASFKKLPFYWFAKDIPLNTIFFYGELELKLWPDINYRHKITKKMPGAKEIIIPHAKHDVTSDVYVKAIKETIPSQLH